jgi:hypothetical protein
MSQDYLKKVCEYHSLLSFFSKCDKGGGERKNATETSVAEFAAGAATYG